MEAQPRSPNGGEGSSLPAAPGGGRRPYVLFLLGLSLFLSFLTLRAFLQTFVFAAVLASVSAPLSGWLERRLRGRRNLAALLVVLVVALAVVVPVLALFSALVAEGVQSVGRVQAWVQQGGVETLLSRPSVRAVWGWAQSRVALLGDVNLSEQAGALAQKAGQVLLAQGTGLVANAAGVLTEFALTLFVLFYLVRDGRDMVGVVRDLSPLEESQKDRLVSRVREVGRSVLLGSLATALCQGVLGGVGLALAGIPGLFWGAVMGVASLVPVVGTALVWVPSAAYLGLAGRWKAALFLVGWCLVLVGSVDNFLRPFLMRGAGGLSPFFVFLAIMGGLQYFGLAGILYGPLILSFTAVMLYIYREEFRPSP